MTYHVCKDNGIFSLNEYTSIDVHLLFDVTSCTWPLLFFLDLESWVVVLAYILLIVPEISNEWSILSYFSLGFPALFVDLCHDLVRYPLLDIALWSLLLEGFDQFFHVQFPIVYGSFLEMINYPFEITWGDLNVKLFELLYFALGALIVLLLEGPELFFCVLFFIVDWLHIPYIMHRDSVLLSLQPNFTVIEEFVDILDFAVYK